MLIALGVTGGIGAYKAVEVARGLQKRGHDVVAVMTRAATRFVGPLTFEAITRRRVITDQFEPGANADIEHIALASTIDLLLVAPATANIIGKFANGIADDFLSTLYTGDAGAGAARAGDEHADVRARGGAAEPRDAGGARRALRRAGRGLSGVRLDRQGPAGRAGRDRRGGRARSSRPQGPLRGQRVLVTAGPTYEDVDPVRYIGNRSSGRMGFAIAAEARAARRRGDARRRSDRARRRRRSARSCACAAPRRCTQAVMRARRRMRRRRSWRPRSPTTRRPIARAAEDGEGRRHADARAEADAGHPGDLGQRRLATGARPAARRLRGGDRATSSRGAAAKRERKHVDLIVANDVSRADAGFDVDTNAVTHRRRRRRGGAAAADARPRVAAAILDRVEQLLGARASGSRRIRHDRHGSRSTRRTSADSPPSSASPASAAIPPGATRARRSARPARDSGRTPSTDTGVRADG